MSCMLPLDALFVLVKATVLIITGIDEASAPPCVIVGFTSDPPIDSTRKGDGTA